MDVMKSKISEKDGKIYSQILKATSIMGGSSLLTIFLRMLRMKVFAVLLGPTGVGLMGVYDSITGLVSSTASLGIGTSGVRQIAEANSKEDKERMSLTIATLRRVALITGIVGSLLMFRLSEPIGRFTFGNLQHTTDLVLLSVTILFATVSGGQIAVIQGVRRIKDLAFLSIIGSFFGSVLSIVIIYIYRERGIAFSLIMISATNVLASWWYSRKVEVTITRVKNMDIIHEAKPLLRLGMVFMSTTLMALGMMYAIRVLVVRYLGLGAAGMYQASIALSSVYVGFILEAMGRDFFPRLTAIAQDNNACISLINKQIEVGLLLAIPGILATLTFAPLFIELFYSRQFLQTYEVLRWQMFGILLRVGSWPLGFLLIAKGNGRMFLSTEALTNCMHFGLMWFGIKYFGLKGTGIAFFTMYIFYCLLIFGVGKKIYQFKLSISSIRIVAMVLFATSIVFLSTYVISDNKSLLFNSCITITVGLFSLKRVIYLSDSKIISDVLMKLNRRLGLSA